MAEQIDPDALRLASLLASDFALHLRDALTEAELYATARDLVRHLRSLDFTPEAAVRTIKEAIPLYRAGDVEDAYDRRQPRRDPHAARERLISYCIHEFFTDGPDRRREPR